MVDAKDSCRGSVAMAMAGVEVVIMQTFSTESEMSLISPVSTYLRERRRYLESNCNCSRGRSSGGCVGAAWGGGKRGLSAATRLAAAAAAIDVENVKETKQLPVGACTKEEAVTDATATRVAGTVAPEQRQRQQRR